MTGAEKESYAGRPSRQARAEQGGASQATRQGPLGYGDVGQASPRQVPAVPSPARADGREMQPQCRTRPGQGAASQRSSATCPQRRFVPARPLCVCSVVCFYHGSVIVICFFGL